MNTDSAFAIGKRHEVCQDYAQSETESGSASAWVADGCSSSKDSDIGARLLVLAAKQSLQTMRETDWDMETSSPDDIGLMAISGAAVSAKMLDVPPETLDATLLSLVCDGRRVCLAAFGDGVIFLKWTDGRTRCLDIELTNGYPDYLSYRLDKARRDKYDTIWRATKGSKVIHGHGDRTELDPHKVYAEVHNISQGGEELEFVAVMSDGVRSFYHRTENGTSEPVPLEEVLNDLIDFKLHSGRFVQRRLNRFLKDAVVRGWEHHDDIAVAAIHFGE